MKLGVPKETRAGERRVALVPESVKRLRAKGFDVTVEAGAGEQAGILDAAYVEAGATVAADDKTSPAPAATVAPVRPSWHCCSRSPVRTWYAGYATRR